VTTLDARGLACPLPLTMTMRRMAELDAGETLRVLATDPEAPIDIAAWAQDEGHAFSEHPPGNGWAVMELRKGG
jgi:tRNA 2-thiouridine synthesizing protein A